MATRTAYVYNGHDNAIGLKLTEDGAPYSLTNVTQVTLTLGDWIVTSTNQAGDLIRWQRPEYKSNEMRIALAGEWTPAGQYDAWLVLYDAANTNGVVWGQFKISIIDEVEGT